MNATLPPPLQFDLILEYQRPVAVIIPDRLPAAQLNTVYTLLPARSVNHPHIAGRWNVALVIATPEWASEQLRRIPMTRPKGQKLAFGL